MDVRFLPGKFQIMWMVLLVNKKHYNVKLFYLCLVWCFLSTAVLLFSFHVFLWFSIPTFLEDNSPTMMPVGLSSPFCQQVAPQPERKECKEHCEPLLLESRPSRGSWFDCTEPMATFTHRYLAIHVRPQEVSFSFTKLCCKNKSR